MPTNRILFNMTPRDRENLAIIMTLYPNPDTMTAALRLALETYIRNEDPVAVEQARKTVRKAMKSEATT